MTPLWKIPWMSAWAVLLLHSVPPIVAEEPDAAAFLERARHQFPPDFVDGPDRSALVRYTWRWTETTAEIERQSHVSQGRITERAVAWVRDGEVMVTFTLSDPGGKGEGQVTRPATEAFDGCRASSTDRSPDVCRRMCDLVWSMLDLEFIGEDTVGDRPVYVFRYHTPDESPKQTLGALEHRRLRMLKLRGTLRFDREEGRLIQASGNYTGRVVLAPGLITGAEIQQGSGWGWTLRRTPSGDWVPDRWERHSALHGTFRKSRTQVIGVLTDLEPVAGPPTTSLP
ncbi:MAG: hypothetical protein WAO20_00570 [Acidobacteriota bacterium]